MTKWAGFPMGLRFVVSDYSYETKRRCWQHVLSSLGCVSYAQVLLFDKETVSLCEQNAKIYLCILSHKPIKQSRKNAKHFLSDTLLLSCLSVYEPIVQENALNLEASNATLIGLVKANGEIVCEDAGKDILPDEIPRRDIAPANKSLLIAPDSMKGMFSASELARRIGYAASCVSGGYRPYLLPIGDGGEGTMLALAVGTHGRVLPAVCRNVCQEAIPAAFAVLPDGTAVVECASAVGYGVMGEQPLLARSSCGVGDLILQALGHGYTHVCVGVGGTATSDCGIGMLHALGLRFYDEMGEELPTLASSLHRVFQIDYSAIPASLLDAKITVLVDSLNPLLGEKGAVRVYAPQKGAGEEDIQTLEEGFLHFSSLLTRVCGDPDADDNCGAGGGIAFALSRVLGAKLVHGIDYVLDTVGFDAMLHDADAVVTAEGRFDSQSIQFGKATKAILDRCQRAQVPCTLLAGSASDEAIAWLTENCPDATLCLADCSGGDASRKMDDGVARLVAGLNS